MSFDELQLAWQHDRAAENPSSANPRVLRQVRSQSRAFSRQIFWRDVREVLASFLVAGVFGNIAWQAQNEGAVAWPAWVAAALPLLVGFYFLIDRWIMRRRAAPQGEDLRTELNRAMVEVKHQIWLLRNVAWWYLAPLALSTALVVVQTTFFGPESFPLFAKVAIWVIMLGTIGWLDYYIWKLNQRAVDRELLPRLQELEARQSELTG